MKNKNKNLRSKIIWTFAIITFLTTVLESMLDSSFDKVIVPWMYRQSMSTSKLIMAVYLCVTVLIYVISAMVFYFIVKKVIKEDNECKMKEKNLLYSTIAHDLKTPITSVQGFSKALLEKRIKEEETEEIYQVIYGKSKQMNELVDLLGEYSKLGTSEYAMKLEDINITSFVRDLVADYYQELENHSIVTDVNIPVETCWIHADKKELGRAFENVILNIVKHNPDGIKAYISLRHFNHTVKITIADAGYEIPDDMNVFEPFITENVARSAGAGNGLGLAITKKIIEQHDGKIYINKKIEGYTKAFEIELPLVK